MITQEISGTARCQGSHYVASQLNLRHKAHFHEGPAQECSVLFDQNHSRMYNYFKTESACVVRTPRQTRLNHTIHVTISGLIQ